MPEAGVVSPVQRSSGLSAVVNSILLRRRNPDWEAAFSRDFVEQQVEQMRFSVAMGIVLVFADFAFDVAANSNKLLLGNEVRLYVIVPLMVAIFSLSFATSLRRHYQILVTVFFVVLAPAFSLSLWLIDKQGWLGLTSYVGALNFMFITIFIFLFLGLRRSQFRLLLIYTMRQRYYCLGYLLVTYENFTTDIRF